MVWLFLVYDVYMSEIILNDKKLDFRTLPKPNKKQSKFIDLWLNPANKETFGNAYLSAKQAGFSDSYARVLTGNVLNVEWVQQAKQLLVGGLQPEHIYAGLQSIAMSSPADRDRIRALELMAKIKGMFIERSQQEVNVTFTNSVPRPVIDTPYVASSDVQEAEVVPQQGSDTSHNE